MWVLRPYEEWLEFVRELLAHPSQEFPRSQVQMHLASTLDTVVSWNWEDPDGSYGFELSHPIPGWPTSEDLDEPMDFVSRQGLDDEPAPPYSTVSRVR